MNNGNFISIIIPTFNTEKYIRRCLEAITNLNYSKDKIEIIVVDGGSKDTTLKTIKEFDVKMLCRQNVTIASLRNLGADSARGDILAFVDADCIVSPDWLTKAVDLLKSDHLEMVGAEYKLPDSPSLIEKIWDLHIDKRRINGEIDWLPSGNIILSKKYFQKVGGFQEDLITSEDVDFCKRIRKMGVKVISDNELSVVHLGNPKNIRGFFSKEFWRGKGSAQNFINALPKIKLTKAMSFALFMLISMLGSIIGLINGLINKNWLVFTIFISGGGLLPLALAAKTLLKKHKWNYLFLLAFLYLVYGVARALCILDYRSWNIFKKAR